MAVCIDPHRRPTCSPIVPRQEASRDSSRLEADFLKYKAGLDEPRGAKIGIMSDTCRSHIDQCAGMTDIIPKKKNL